MKNIFKYLPVALVLTAMTSACDLNILPEDSLSGSQMAVSPKGLEDIMNGCYSTMKDEQTEYSNAWYLRQYFQLSDFASDDVTYGWGTEDNLHMIFVYDQRDPSLDNFTAFWAANYKLIYSANVCLDIAAQKEESDEVNYIKAEALFVKAFAMHNLVRYYALPYNDANKNTPGIIIRENGTDSAPKERATVERTYGYILDLLEEAEGLFKSVEYSPRSENKGFASLGAVHALYSRVYLYMGNWDKCIEYSGYAIDDHGYSLTSAAGFPKYFANAATEDETIWCVRMVDPDDNHESGSIASMIMTKGNGCWGEEGYSPSLLEAMDYNDGERRAVDTRCTFVQKPEVNSSGLTLYPCSKFSEELTGSKKTISSPVMFRLAEMYLNRAEAYAHKNDPKAIDDVNEVIEHRIDLTKKEEGSQLTIDDFKRSASEGNLLDIVLEERRKEFAFEGFRFFDLLRNGKDIVRNYWGYHLPSFTPGTVPATPPGLSVAGVVIKPDNPHIICPIPTKERANNALCEQNEGYK